MVCTEVPNGEGVEDEVKVIFYAVYVFRGYVILLLYLLIVTVCFLSFIHFASAANQCK